MLPEEAAEGEYTHRLFQTQGCRALKQQKSLATASDLTPEGRLALRESETKAASARL